MASQCTSNGNLEVSFIDIIRYQIERTYVRTLKQNNSWHAECRAQKLMWSTLKLNFNTKDKTQNFNIKEKDNAKTKQEILK